jgi:peptidoglycan/xylan/chitin deacetylase (PgdA/CDA1 family)
VAGTLAAPAGARPILARTTGAQRRSEPSVVLDAVGAALALAAVAWQVVSWAASGGSPWPGIGVLLAAAGALAAGRLAFGSQASLAPMMVVAVAVALALFFPRGLFGDGAASGPFHYGNAKGAFFLQAALAGGIVAMTAPRRPIRIAGGAAAVAFTAMALTAGALPATVTLLVVPVALLAPFGPRQVPLAVVTGSILVVAAVAFTVGVASGPAAGADDVVDREVISRLDERVPLWRAAFALLHERPVAGVGPGRFQAESGVGAGDRDLRWAHHEFLQQGAEGGVPALVLLGLLFAWGFARLWATPRPRGGTVLGAASLAALGLQASADYVLHFPAVVIAAGAVLGAAQAGDRPIAAEAFLRKAVKSGALAAGSLAGRRREGDVTVLLYHRVGAGSREVDVAAEAFEAQAEELARRGMVRTLDEALEGRGGVVLTIDDGYGDFHDRVLPVLARHRLPALLYLATGLVEDGLAPSEEALTWAQLREAVATGLVRVGSHTHTHADLAAASPEAIEEEMRRSKGLVEDRLGIACRHFAFPWGVASPEAEAAARRHFESAALRWGTNRRGRMEPYRLARTPVMRSDGPVFFRAKVNGLLDGEALAYRLLRRGPWRVPS